MVTPCGAQRGNIPPPSPSVARVRLSLLPYRVSAKTPDVPEAE